MTAQQTSVSKAIALLSSLDRETRDQVLSRMPEAQQRHLRDVLSGDKGGTPTSPNITAQRTAMRETVSRMSERNIAEADREIAAVAGIRPYDGQGPAPNPLGRLATVHPAALARALQGERAEAWAMVLTPTLTRTRWRSLLPPQALRFRWLHERFHRLQRQYEH